MSAYLQVPNWEQLQQYKHRSPPWIKLHSDILESYEFECLHDASKAHLICIYLLASRTKNKINADAEWIARKIGANSKVDIKSLIDSGFLELKQDDTECLQDASTMLAPRYKDRCTSRVEERRVEERRVEENKPVREKKSTSKNFVKPNLTEITKYCDERKNTVDPISFFNHYVSNGWRVGKNLMQDWHAAIGTWERRENNGAQKPQEPDAVSHDYFKELNDSLNNKDLDNEKPA